MKIIPLLNVDPAVLTRHHGQVSASGQTKLVIGPENHGITRSQIPASAQKVIDKLNASGFKAYLVGGGVRDLLLGMRPKDFDVSTNATPEQVRRVFPNSRIIGRRFKIVHVVFGNDITEVTTFRSNQQEKTVTVASSNGTRGYRGRDNSRTQDQEGMLVRDNIYGKDISEDADRRDFTINAIYYDLKSGELIDFNGGLYDLEHGLIDLIGDPQVRYLEDPVRMIRALRFCAKLRFKMSDRTSTPIRELSDKLEHVSNARMFEEVNKLFLMGHGAESFRILNEFHLLEILFPGIARYVHNTNFAAFTTYALQSSDERFRDNKRNMPHFLYSLMLWPAVQSRVMELTSRNGAAMEPSSLRTIIEDAAAEILREQDKMTAIPYGVESTITSTWKLQYRLLNTRDPNNTRDVVRRSFFRGAFDFFKLRASFEPFLKPFVDFWQPFYDESAALARRRREEREEADRNRQEKRKRRAEKRREQSRDTPATPVSEAEENFGKREAAEENERLARARAWRAAMKLAP